MTIIFRKLKFTYMETKKSNRLSYMYVAIQRQKVLNSSYYIYGNGPGFLQSDWLIAGPYNTIRTTFFNFCRKSSIFQVSIVLASEIVKIRCTIFVPFYFRTFKYRTSDS